MASNYGSVRELRQGAVQALRELKSRWARVSTRLRHLQPDAIRTAAQQRDLGLLGLLVVLLSWGDVTMPLRFAQGLPAVGLAPPYGIFPQQPALPITLEDVFFDCEAHNSEIKASLKPGLRDDFLLSQSLLMQRPGSVPRRSLGAGDSWEADSIDSPVCHSAVLGQAAHYRQRPRRRPVCFQLRVQ